MSKRLQVLIEESEYRKFSKQARAEGKNLGEWVRQSLRTSLRSAAGDSPEKKMGKIRELAQKNGFPVSDIERLLNEIERGYLGDIR